MNRILICLLTSLLLQACAADDGPRRIDPDLSPADLVLPARPDPQSPELPEGIPLRVMSYNIYGGKYATAEEIGAFLAGQDLDLVGLQECPEDFPAPIAEAAGFEHYTGAGVALLSKTPLIDPQQISLNSGRSFVHARSEIGGQYFSIYVAHLGWNLDGDHQCREFVDEHLAIDPMDHLVLMGDFNDEHMSSQISILEEVVADAFSALGWYPGQRISWPSTHFDDTEGSQLIDLIFFRRDFAPIVITADVLNLAPVLSDHKPVRADLLYPPSDQPFAQDPYAPLRDPRADWPETLPDNLLTNPGAEEGLAGWQIEGAGQAAAERDNQTPHTGSGMFTGFSERPGQDVRWSSGAQAVDLSDWAEAIDGSGCRLLAAGAMATGFTLLTDESHASNMARPYDEGEVIIEGLAGLEGRSLVRQSSGRRDTLDWHPFALSQPLPVGARAARLTWLSHHKVLNGSSNDAVFDDLYLGIDCAADPHPMLGPNLLQNPGAEQNAGQTWQPGTWQVLPDMENIGLAVFPPLSHSGRGLWFAGGPLDLEPGPASLSTLAQKIELEEYFDSIDQDGLALRWGGWLRTWAAKTHVGVALEIYDGEGGVWGRVEGGEVFAAEWTGFEYLTHIPAGASAVRLVLEADVEPLGTGVFADDLYVFPENMPDSSL